jgi:maltoporin
MKHKTKLTIVFCAGSVIASHAVLAMECNRNFRANTRTNAMGGGQDCFGLTRVGSKYRLGKECGIYGEFQVNHHIVTTDDGTIFKDSILFDCTSGVTGDPRLIYTPERPNSDQNLDLPQVYVTTGHLPGLGGATAWMGRCYNKREMFHITDFIYWNPSGNMGLGADIEELPIGDNRSFSYPLFRDDSRKTPPTLGPTTNESNGVSEAGHDARPGGIHVNDGGNLPLSLSVISEESQQEDSHGGYMMTLRQHQSGLFGKGENKWAIQVTTGAAVGSHGGTGNLGYDRDLSQFRIAEGHYSQLMKRFGGQLVFVYDKVSVDGFMADQEWTSFGGRKTYALTPQIKPLADQGRDRIEPSDGGTKARLTKYTLSVALSVGSEYYSWPELRLFYTHTSWNEAASSLGANADDTFDTSGDPMSAYGAFGDDTNGSVIGLSVEAWW